MSYEKKRLADKTKLLHQAVKDEDLNCVTSLCAAGVDINAPDAYGSTPLMIASDRGALPIVEELLERKAKVNLHDHYGQTALIFASFGGHWNVARTLIEHKASVNAETKFKQTALMKAAYGNSLAVVSLLAANKAHIDARSKDGRTALMIAADNNNLNIVQYLAEVAKADANATDNDDNTAIMLAARKAHALVVEYLAQLGVDLESKNKYGETVYDIQPENGSTNIADLRSKVEKAIKRGQQARQAAEEASASGLAVPTQKHARVPSAHLEAIPIVDVKENHA
jgi:ankyrin repeat protein